MLSRTADHLFWMARYIERAENTARMLDVNMSTSLLPQSADVAEHGWRAMLSISELQSAFDVKYSRLTARDVLDFMVRDPGNASSIFTTSGAAARKFRNQISTGNVGINIGVAAPMAYFPFSGWKGSFFGTLHAQGRDAIEFYTDKKVVIERWPKEWSRKF